jgi:sugar phosphate isomerase/epimerase
MRLTAEVPEAGIAEIIEACHRLGISGTGFDPSSNLDLETSRAAFAPIFGAGLSIVQVGCYRNLISVDEKVRQQGIDDVVFAMNVAGKAGVESVVCGGGHRDPAVPAARRSVHRDNWTGHALDVMIESCQEIVARVDKDAAPLCLEPWVITCLNSPARLEQVVRAVDHPKLAVDLDLANLVTLENCFETERLINDCFDRFGDKVRLVHLKDARLTPEPYIYHIGEAVVGDGMIDHAALLRQLAGRAPQASLMVEHLSSEAEIARALGHMRTVAGTLGYEFA